LYFLQGETDQDNDFGISAIPTGMSTGSSVGGLKPIGFGFNELREDLTNTRFTTSANREPNSFINTFGDRDFRYFIVFRTESIPDLLTDLQSDRHQLLVGYFILNQIKIGIHHRDSQVNKPLL
jgi:hypothetical protein